MRAQQISTQLPNIYVAKSIVCSAHPARVVKIPRSLMGIYRNTYLCATRLFASKSELI